MNDAYDHLYNGKADLVSERFRQAKAAGDSHTNTCGATKIVTVFVKLKDHQLVFSTVAELWGVNWESLLVEVQLHRLHEAI